MKIGELIAGTSKPFFSLEFFPPSQPEQMESFYGAVADLAELRPLFVSVTYGAGGKKQQNTLETTKELATRGLDVMAHLTCVGASGESIADFLRQLKAEGINNVLALRGDPPAVGEWDWNQGKFRHASDLVAFIKKEMPEMGVGVAAYPSPHPESATYEADRAATAQKLAMGADFAISQMFFDAREYMDLVAGLARAGINVPIIPGIMTIQSFESLRRILSLCGANIPGKLYLELESANEQGGAEAVREAGVRFAVGMIRQLLDFGAPGVHLYTLNKSGLSRRIISESGLMPI